MNINYWEILQKNRGTLSVFSLKWDFLGWLADSAKDEQVIVVADTCAILSHVQELIDRETARFATFNAELSIFSSVGRPPEEVIIFLPFRVRLELEKLAKSRRSALAARALELSGPRIVWQSAMDYARDLAFMDELVTHVRRSTNMIVAVASGDDHILRNTLLLRAYAEEYAKSVVFYTNDREFQGKMRRNGVPTYVSPQLELR